MKGNTRIDAQIPWHPDFDRGMVTELFFETPQRLQHPYPAIYDELRRFYLQDPIRRQS